MYMHLQPTPHGAQLTVAAYKREQPGLRGHENEELGSLALQVVSRLLMDGTLPLPV